MNLLMKFTLLTIINVIFSTIKSLTTVKCNKYIASIISAGYYAYYNIVLIFTVSDFPLYQKILITFFCNLIGVFTVKLFEEKMTKDKLWKIECTLPKEQFNKEMFTVPYNYIDIGKYILVNCYCENKEQSKIVKEILTKHKAKYFVSESKNL